MLHNEDIKNLSELKSTFVQKHKKERTFLEFIDILKIGKHHALFANVKTKGVPVLLIIKVLICFPLVEQSNVWSFIGSYWNKFIDKGKDVYYRLLRNEKINWRKFLHAVVRRILLTLAEREEDTSNKRVTAFVFDDTPIEKTGFTIEGVSRIWNHVIKRSVLGYQLLTMGLYDGSMFLPIDFSFHREKGSNTKKPFGLSAKQKRKQCDKRRDSKTAGYKRKRELDISKIESAVNMLTSAVKSGFTAQYVITDSWFTCWQLVRTALENRLQYIGMFSKVKTLFEYNKKKFSYKEIRQKNRKHIKRNKRYNLYYIRVVVKWNDRPVVLYFTRKGKNGNWKTLLSTDLSLGFNETIEIYQLRWSIEVFFKESKQHLSLGKCQSTNFDAQIADTTIRLIQYLFLALRHRIDNYESIGKAFEDAKCQSLELRLHKRLILLLIEIIEIFEELFEDIDEEKLFRKLINDERSFERIKLLINSENNEMPLVA